MIGMAPFRLLSSLDRLTRTYPNGYNGWAQTHFSRSHIRPLQCGRNWSSCSKAMTRLRISCLLMFAFASATRAQTSADAANLREVLDRLARLEESNRELLGEVKALRSELAAHGIANATPD